MKLTQVTHHDLDGYGASTVVGAYADVDRVIHVSRYADVGMIVETELGRLRRAEQAETLMMTDLGLEPAAVAFIKTFAAMNAKRGRDLGHRLIVLDHHASSIAQLAQQGLFPTAPPPGTDVSSLKRFSVDDAAIVVAVDESRCATRLGDRGVRRFLPNRHDGARSPAACVACPGFAGSPDTPLLSQRLSSRSNARHLASRDDLHRSGVGMTFSVRLLAGKSPALGYTAAFEAKGPASLEMLALLPTRPPDSGFRDAGDPRSRGDPRYPAASSGARDSVREPLSRLRAVPDRCVGVAASKTGSTPSGGRWRASWQRVRSAPAVVGEYRSPCGVTALTSQRQRLLVSAVCAVDGIRRRH